jgi:hypothetical protein
MARKIDLKTLFESNALTVTLVNGTQVGGAGPEFMFDGEPLSSGASKFVIDDDAGAEIETFRLDFLNPINSKRARLDVRTRLTEAYTVRFNDDVSTDQTHTVADTSTVGELGTFSFDGDISSILVFAQEAALNTNHEFHEMELFIAEENTSFQYEFNDSVLSTKAWNSSRYDGKQLRAKKINKFIGTTTNTTGLLYQPTISDPDISFGKTPVLQNYSRNIYIGNKIVGLDSSNPSPEDETLVQFTDFSYVQTNQYFTVNSDDSITVNILDEVNNEDYSSKKGYYRSFYQDFPIKDRCQIILLDDSVESGLRSQYPIYFNGGQLKKLVKHQPDEAKKAADQFMLANTKHVTGSLVPSIGVDLFQILKPSLANVDINQDNMPDFFNTEILRQFHPTFDILDFIGATSAANDVAVSAVQRLILDGLVYGGKLNSWEQDGNAFVRNRVSSSFYNGDKRLFVSFVSSGSDEPIHSVQSGSTHTVLGSALYTNDLGELSTNEIVGLTGSNTNGDTANFVLSDKIHIPQNLASLGSDANVSKFASGSFLISITDDSNPSLLIPLKKDTTLPSGIGSKPFVVIPSNLHPFIKDNLTYFLIKAGIDIGDRKETPVLKEKRRFLD